jgi:caffeoyl-CoA O-methyltransferase
MFDWDEIERYAAEHSTPAPELFERLAEETRATQPTPSMMIGPVGGALLSFVVHMAKPSLVLEIGTFTGWSSIAMALALPPHGKIITCDIDPDRVAIARRYAEEAGVADRIQYMLGPALDTIEKLDGPFDLVFIDADKGGYVDYYEASLPKLADDGVILADNTLFAVLGDETGKALDRFNAHVRDDPRVEQVLLTVREGITLIRRARA